jgi:hypothetical protein
MKIAIDRPMQTLTAIAMSAVMAMTLTAFSCNTLTIQAWLSKANAILPALETQAQDVIQIADPSDVALATHVSQGVSAALTLVTNAITAYSANPSASTLQNLSAALAAAGAALPAVLSNVTFANPDVGLAIEAAVTAISVSLDILAEELPVSSTPAVKSARRNRLIMAQSVHGQTLTKGELTVSALNANWNHAVCDQHPIAHCPRL